MNHTVVVSSPVWSLNGVNVFAANLVRGLRDEGLNALVLLTHPEQPDLKPLPLPDDVPVERLATNAMLERECRRRVLRSYLEARSPCIYLPNHDFDHSIVCVDAPRDVLTVGIVHSPDKDHLAHVRALGRHWDAIVAVSDEVESKVAAEHPSLIPRLRRIHHGVDVADPSRAGKPSVEHRLEIVYAGRLVQGGKRVFELVVTAEALVELGVRFRLTVAGTGADAAELELRAAGLIDTGHLRLVGTLSNNAVRTLFAQSHAVVLPSSFEGLPLCLLEGMAAGCVAVASLPAAPPLLVRDGHNGFVVELGDVQGYARRLSRLQRNPQLAMKMSANAVETVKREFSRSAMAARYRQLFGEITAGSTLR